MSEQKYHRLNIALALMSLVLFLYALGVLAVLLGVSLLIGGSLWSRRAVVQEEQRQSEQLALLQQMSAVVAHELRNPLASAKGNTQLLAEMLEPGSRSQSKAEQVVQELVRVEHLTNDLLAFIRSGKINRRPCDLSSLLHSLTTSAEVGVFCLSLESAPKQWSLDKSAMERVLLNLIRNALQAQEGAALPIEITARQERGYLYISVRDHGPGPALGVDWFAPFVTTKTTGTGLGLALSHQIVQAHQGRLSLQRHPEGGAIAEILIPGV